MRQELEHYLNRVWYGHARPPGWLIALSPVYRVASRLNRLVQRARRPERLFGAAIVVVGNLTAGGSGKTPLVIRLCQVFTNAGLKAGVISRGYGRLSHGMLRVEPASDPAEVGDEPLLIARRAGVPVVVARDRCAAAELLLREGLDVIISDDGLQHYRLPRTVEICVIDSARQFGNGHLLPAGPLREPLRRLREVDYVVVNESADRAENPALAAAIAGHTAVPMHLAPGWLRSLDGELSWRISQFTGCRVNAVAGIGHPERFFKTLQQAGLKTCDYAFPDHHVFTREDFAVIKSDLPIIMTEKDAVKCTGMRLPNAWYLSVEAALPGSFESELVARIRFARDDNHGQPADDDGETW